MKPLLVILLAGTVAFLAIAMTQEWPVFAQAISGKETTAPVLSEGEKKAAADALHLTLRLLGHLYSSGGDSRFAERMPASEAIITEAMSDIRYLAHNHRRQEMELERLDVTGVDPLVSDRIILRTREYWRLREIIGSAGDPDTSSSLFRSDGSYLLLRGSSGWRVESWDIAAPAPQVGRTP